MNAKQLFAALAIAMAGNVAMAGEATEFKDPVSTLSRAAAQQSAVKSAVVQNNEATVFAETPNVRQRDEVRAEARQAARQHAFNPLYVGA
jgi:hypothetical protein